MKKPLFTPSYYYHLYNHSNGNDLLFIETMNYPYFLAKWRYYTAQLFDTVAFCLMPNHFHFLVRVKDDIYNHKKNQHIDDPKLISSFISQRLSNFFNCYSKSINRRYSRMGSLFNQNFKRKLINNDEYLKYLMCYIHLNPVKHGFTSDIFSWEFSSIHDYASDNKSWIQKDILLGFFRSNADLIDFHQEVNLTRKIKEKIQY